MPNQIKDLHTIDEKSFPYIFEQNVTVPLKTSDGLVRLNVYRPHGSGESKRVPVIVTYGKQSNAAYIRSTNTRATLTRNPQDLTGRTSLTNSSTQNLSPKSIRTRRVASTLAGRRRIQTSGPAADMLWSELMREVLVNLLANSTPCLEAHQKHSLTLSNGQQNSLGHLARSASLVSPTTLGVNGGLPPGSPKDWPP